MTKTTAAVCWNTRQDSTKRLHTAEDLRADALGYDERTRIVIANRFDLDPADVKIIVVKAVKA